MSGAMFSAGNQPGFLDVAKNMLGMYQQAYNLRQNWQQQAYQSLWALRDDPNASWGDVANAYSSAERGGVNTTQFVNDMNAAAAQGMTPQEYIRERSLRTLAPGQQAELVLPGRETYQTAQGMMYGVAGGMGGRFPGQFAQQGFVQRGFTPGEAAQYVQAWDEQQQRYVPVPLGSLQGSMPWAGGGAVAPGSYVGGPRAGQSVQAAPQAGGDGGPVGPMPQGASLDQLYQQAGQRWGVDPSLLRGVAQVESGQRTFDRGGRVITSPAGAQGIMQFIPSTAKQYGVNVADPNSSIDGAAHYLSDLIQKNNGNVGAALQEYNGAGGDPNMGYARRVFAASGGGPQIDTAQIAMNTAPQGPPAGMFPVGGPQAAPQVFSPYGNALTGGAPIGPPAGGYGAMPGALPAPGQGQVESLQTTAKANTDLYNADATNYANFSQAEAPWNNSLNILREFPKLLTGPGSQDLNKINTVLQNLGLPTILQSSGDPKQDQLAALQELTKYLEQGVQQLPGWGRSDLDNLHALAASPNPSVQNYNAVRRLVVGQIGRLRFQQARYLYWNQNFQGQPITQYRESTSPWLSTQDMNGYQFDLMTPNERANYLNSLPGGAKGWAAMKFRHSVDAAEQLFPDVANMAPE